MAEHQGKTHHHHKGGEQFLPLGGLFFLTYIGAAIYFVQQSDGSFWEVILALLQAFVWPVYVMYHVLVVLGV